MPVAIQKRLQKDPSTPPALENSLLGFLETLKSFYDEAVAHGARYWSFPQYEGVELRRSLTPTARGGSSQERLQGKLATRSHPAQRA